MSAFSPVETEQREMPEAQTVLQILEQGPDSAPAISAPGRPSLSHAGLRRQIEETVEALNRLGIGRNDPVAIVLPNGPEMASAFLSIASASTTAPLNPAYKEAELAFYLGDLQARLLVVLAGEETAATRVARRLGIAVAELSPSPEGTAGRFSLRGQTPFRMASAGGPAQSSDTALVLHTSGTTSRPKMVPLSHRNLSASAAHISATLELGVEDCCLNIMPLFHIHGLVAAVLSSLGAGGQVFCTPGFDALRFFAWIQESRPTWYTAVPTMHQAILLRAARHRRTIESGRLRLIRSSSASLAPHVMARLETTFGAPVIESYGMTEAAHQMTSNPLPPGRRKPGSVGPAAGPEVAIMDEEGNLLAAGEVGEVVIRGPNVTEGYRNNPEANRAAFCRGWFRTGDLGRMDEEGYLYLAGRLKEIINRGGEKISPREVDEVLLEHPAVEQAVTFALPHPRLGEEVAAAVVLSAGCSATEGEIREFARQRLTDFKVPRRVVLLDEIPKGPTGKLQRIGLAKTLGLAE